MKILHTADLHLGRQFNGIALEEDHAVILDQMVRAIIARDINVLIIAGDIFDRAAPPAAAVRQFNNFLSRIASETTAAVVMIAGNHDSGDRIGSMAVMTDTRRALIRRAVAADEAPLVIEDEHGPVAFSGLPFSYEYAARECFAEEAIKTPQDVLAAQVTAAKRNLPEGTRWVIVAHAFVAGAQGSESERPLGPVGGIETVAPEIFDGAHYVALGHLHRPQSAGAPHIRYSGSPLAFSFDEADSHKSMNLVEIDGAGNVRIEIVPFEPLRGVRILRGRLAELLLAEPSNDFVKTVLTDDSPPIDPMKRLRTAFPNACQLAYEREESPFEFKPLAPRTKIAQPMDIIGDFLQQVRGERMTEAESAIVTSALENIRNGENAE